jgi:phage terminase large subunit-like protein
MKHPETTARAVAVKPPGAGADAFRSACGMDALGVARQKSRFVSSYNVLSERKFFFWATLVIAVVHFGGRLIGI